MTQGLHSCIAVRIFRASLGWWANVEIPRENQLDLRWLRVLLTHNPTFMRRMRRPAANDNVCPFNLCCAAQVTCRQLGGPESGLVGPFQDPILVLSFHLFPFGALSAGGFQDSS